MEFTTVLRNIQRASDANAAFQALVVSLASVPLRAAAWLDAEQGLVHMWPSEGSITPELSAMALNVPRPELFPLRSEFPVDGARYPDTEVLVLPLRPESGSRGACVLIAPVGVLSEESRPWEAVAEGLTLVQERAKRSSQSEAKQAELQRRLEEAEALHTIGLAANRSLHSQEVLDLVARFARTLLSADYVTVNTVDAGRIFTVASVGLRHTDGAESDYRLARTIVQAARPVLVGGSGGSVAVQDHPFHTAEGMRRGLGIPLSLFGETFGALVIGYRVDRDVTPRDIRFALTLAGHAAVAISNARLHEQVQKSSIQLQEAYEELSRLTQAKERFFASINHELRNPIGAVLGYLTLVLDGTFGEIPSSVRNFVQKAHRSAVTLRELVNDILDLSKIAAGEMDLNIARVSLSEVIDGALNTIEPLAANKEIPVLVEPMDALPALHTDAHRVQQILVNLLSNAVKFTTEGAVRLRAEVVAESQPSETSSAFSQWLDLTVEDTGPGIQPEDQPLVFEEFKQVKGTKGGTGLGLPISRRLARLLGGDLRLQSTPGAGSKFILRLPCGPPRVAETTALSEHSAPQGT